MTQVIARLLQLLEQLKTTEPRMVKNVVEVSETKGVYRLKPSDLPMLQVIRQSSESVIGEFGNTKKRIFSIKIRMIIPQSDSTTKNIPILDDLEERVETIVSSKEFIHGIVDDGFYYQLEPEQSTTRFEIVGTGEDTSIFDASDLIISVSRTELWTGTVNRQRNGIKLNSI